MVNLNLYSQIVECLRKAWQARMFGGGPEMAGGPAVLECMHCNMKSMGPIL